jgi:hypothetical protein
VSDERAAFRAAYAQSLAGFHADARSAALLAAISASAWNRSGCMAFATAVVDTLGGTLMSIGWYALLADHVVVVLGDTFLDADGTYNEAEILAKYSERARAPLAIWPVESSTVTPPAGGPQHRAALAALLESHLPSTLERRAREPAADGGPERRRRPRPRKATEPHASRTSPKS